MGKRVAVDEMGRIKLSDFRELIRSGRSSGKPVVWSFSLRNTDYKIYYVPEKNLLLLNWHRGGEEKAQKILLREAKSNLGLNSVLYFVCPYTGRSCRKLFTDGWSFFSMYALKDGYTYSARNESKNYRQLSKLLKEPPDLRHRKPYYRGELTPFGKSFAKAMTQAEEAERQGFPVLRQRGRPRVERPSAQRPQKRGKKRPPYTPPLFDI